MNVSQSCDSYASRACAYHAFSTTTTPSHMQFFPPCHWHWLAHIDYLVEEFCSSVRQLTSPCHVPWICCHLVLEDNWQVAPDATWHICSCTGYCEGNPSVVQPAAMIWAAYSADWIIGTWHLVCSTDINPDIDRRVLILRCLQETLTYYYPATLGVAYTQGPCPSTAT